jgi:hypothetical protein
LDGIQVERLFGVWIDGVDWQVVVVCGELPAPVLFFLKTGFVGEELVDQLALVRGGGLVLEVDHDAVVPATILGGVEAGGVDGVTGDVAELLFAVESGYLVLAEDAPPLVFVAVLDAVEPLDGVRFGGGGRLSECSGGRDGDGQDKNREEMRDRFAHR